MSQGMGPSWHEAAQPGANFNADDDGMLADAEEYPLDEALSLLLDHEAHALTGEVAAMQTPEGDLESGDIPF